MNDIVVELELAEARDEEALANAIEAYAVWREESFVDAGNDSEAPDIMVKTLLFDDIIQKKLIFQDRKGADKFLSIWSRISESASA